MRADPTVATMTCMSQPRSVTKVVTAHRQLEGAGFTVRRPFPSAGLALADPFLMLDEMGPVDYGPGDAVGAPDHPHRGFETVSYILAGETEHEDSAGHRGLIGPGDVQWMTAGRGLVHSELPSRAIRERGGRVHGFQLWVNLPAKDKMIAPRYQEIPRAQIPGATTADGLASVKVIAGRALGVGAAIDTRTPIALHDWTLRPGAAIDVPLPADHAAYVYVFEGAATIADRTVGSGQLAVLGAGETIAMSTTPAGDGARLLVLAGVPLGEPVASYGPFVMNTREELMQAVRDYNAGRMGEIAR